jgi:hypothetical protein
MMTNLDHFADDISIILSYALFLWWMYRQFNMNCLYTHNKFCCVLTTSYTYCINRKYYLIFAIFVSINFHIVSAVICLQFHEPTLFQLGPTYTE